MPATLTWVCYLLCLTLFNILGQFDLKKALRSALGGGLSGAAGDAESFPMLYIV